MYTPQSPNINSKINRNGLLILLNEKYMSKGAQTRAKCEGSWNRKVGFSNIVLKKSIFVRLIIALKKITYNMNKTVEWISTSDVSLIALLTT
jgi:hypothetical protein